MTGNAPGQRARESGCVQDHSSMRREERPSSSSTMKDEEMDSRDVVGCGRHDMMLFSFKPFVKS